MESVDTGDLKSPALMSVRVRVPPVLPSIMEEYPKVQCTQTDKEEMFVYNRYGRLVNIRNLWRNNI